MTKLKLTADEIHKIATAPLPSFNEIKPIHSGHQGKKPYTNNTLAKINDSDDPIWKDKVLPH